MSSKVVNIRRYPTVNEAMREIKKLDKWATLAFKEEKGLWYIQQFLVTIENGKEVKIPSPVRALPGGAVLAMLDRLIAYDTTLIGYDADWYWSKKHLRFVEIPRVPERAVKVE